MFLPSQVKQAYRRVYCESCGLRLSDDAYAAGQGHCDDCRKKNDTLYGGDMAEPSATERLRSNVGYSVGPVGRPPLDDSVTMDTIFGVLKLFGFSVALAAASGAFYMLYVGGV